MFLFYMLARNLFGGGAKAPPPGFGFHPAVTHGDPLSMRVFITEQPDIDLDSVSTAPRGRSSTSRCRWRPSGATP